MKKIIATLTVIAATALGAQGQTTNTFPAGTGTNSFSGLTFGGTSVDPSQDFDQVRLLFYVTGFDFGSSGGKVTLTGITLSGQGISNSLSFGDVTVSNNSTGYNAATSYVPLNSPVVIWNPTVNTTAFTAEFKDGASALYGAQIFYGLSYANFSESIIRNGNMNLVAVPEPSTYFAAAGLLGLFLWSARRHLFKLTGSRSTSTGSASNGAA